jgi:polyhydroxyalkanoate synthesis regulator phasin
MDVGTEHEVKIEGAQGVMGKNKLDQLWDDLVDKGKMIP